MTMQPHQQRVVDEKTELDDKLGKLVKFYDTDIYAKLDEAERVRLSSCDVYCPQRDSEQKKRQQITAYRPTAAEVERSERQGDLIAMYRAEY